MPLIEKIISLSLIKMDQIPEDAITLAQFSLLDWIVCGVAGIDEPLAVKLRRLAEKEAGAQVASTFGGGRVPARMAALVNGATSHALDYDDTHFAHVGHLSVGIYPAALAVAEEQGKTVQDAVAAFVVGAEVAIRIGIALGQQHYDHGFHQTATAGAFGATVAVGRLYGLSAEEMRHAIGLCATRASGLKSQFGTMGKPYNAGISASNGVEVAQLASLGFTSAEDALMGDQGFVPTHSQSVNEDAAWSVQPAEKFLFEDNKYKLHACCHGLHAMIEALQGHNIKLEEVTAVNVRTNPRWLRVCDKKNPATGLEVKFSYAWLAGMTLRGDATGDDRLYSDALACDAELAAFAQKVVVAGSDNLTDTEVEGELILRDGRKLLFSHDLFDRIPADVLQERLRTKAVAILGPKGQRVWALQTSLNRLMAVDLGQHIAAFSPPRGCA
jgi:2-methylcitrate dehydratase PrpD